MNGRDCGALGWDGSDAVMIGSKKSPRQSKKFELAEKNGF
jgi:hypothetical protein